MAQGTRVRWMRAAIAGFGMLASTGLVGCMNWDKPKETKSTTPKAGLPGTPTLPPGGAAQAKWQPGPGQYAGPGNNLQQTGGFAAGAPARTGTNNLNTAAGAGQQYGNWPPTGSPGTIGAPTQPGVTPSVQPAGGFGPVGANPIQPAGGAIAGYGPTSPPPPDLLGGPLPPPAPPHPSSNEYAATGGVLPPVPGGPLAPLAPIAPPAPPVVNHSVGVFGGK